MTEAILESIDADEAVQLFGFRDAHLNEFRERLGVHFKYDNQEHKLRLWHERSDHVANAVKTLERMRARIRTKRPFALEDVRMWIDAPGEAARADGVVEIFGPIRRLKSRTVGQSAYIAAVRNHDLTFCIGPAGTGKTYLAVAAALEALQRQQVKRIVLVRPAVEAGEKLGYLPGDLQAKVHPFVRPLLDALRDMIDFHQVKRYMDEDVVEIAPLAYMRGRTLNDAFVILDEGQNTTVPQMKMFLTRMGMNSRIVVTGDVTQVDLPGGVRSGLHDAVRRLTGVPRVAVVEMLPSDIVRHPLVEAIVRAYDDDGSVPFRPPPANSPAGETASEPRRD
jgi:phosphate starvation-inducible PhoH-like protein